MTDKQAAGHLEDLIKDRESFMLGDYDEDIYNCDKEALEMAIQALKKQSKKKVTIQSSTGGVCPNCNRFIDVGTWRMLIPPKYCFVCGQALKWGEEVGT